jgi:hypothetical protein
MVEWVMVMLGMGACAKLHLIMIMAVVISHVGGQKSMAMIQDMG